MYGRALHRVMLILPALSPSSWTMGSACKSCPHSLCRLNWGQLDHGAAVFLRLLCTLKVHLAKHCSKNTHSHTLLKHRGGHLHCHICIPLVCIHQQPSMQAANLPSLHSRHVCRFKNKVGLNSSCSQGTTGQTQRIIAACSGYAPSIRLMKRQVCSAGEVLHSLIPAKVTCGTCCSGWSSTHISVAMYEVPLVSKAQLLKVRLQPENVPAVQHA